MNIVKYKKILLIAIIALLSVFVANSLTFLAITLHNKFKDILEETNELTKYFAKGVGTESNPYLITSNDHMDNFFDLMHGGKTFAGEYITLGADISYETKARATALDTEEETGNEAISVFGGTIDGGGHTIQLDSDSLFNEIIGDVKIFNTRIVSCSKDNENMSVTSSSNIGIVPYSNEYTKGGIVDVNPKGATLSYVNSEIIHYFNAINVECYTYGGVCGKNEGTVRVTNCFIYTHVDWPSERSGNVGVIVGDGNTPIVSNCIIDGMCNGDVLGQELTGTFYRVGAGAGNVPNWKTSTLSMSSIGGAYISSPWYYASDYNSHYIDPHWWGGQLYTYAVPVLRSIITWTGCKIEGDHAYVGLTKNPTSTTSCSISLPADASKTYSVSGTEAKSLTIYDRTIYSSGKGICHAGNIVWTSSTPFSYTVTWNRTQRAVVINELSNCSTSDYAYDNSKMVLVYCGAIVSATFEDDYINSNAHGTMTISFKNAKDESISYTFKANDGYYFDSSKIADMYTASNNISMAGNEITLHEDLRLTIDNMCVPKEYEVGWG